MSLSIAKRTASEMKRYGASWGRIFWLLLFGSWLMSLESYALMCEEGGLHVYSANKTKAFPLHHHPIQDSLLTINILRREILVDGDVSDWDGIVAHVVTGEKNLWIGQGMTRKKWQGDQDLSFRWRSAWNENRLYFLFEVTDDKHIDPPQQPNSFLNDCIEILLDHRNRDGLRVVEDNNIKTLRGYEMHFLPSSPPQVFLDDALSPMYPMDKPQNELFENSWQGEVSVRKISGGYIMEIGFSIPGINLERDLELGMDVAVCDDDGNGRKALQIWTGKQVDFWITMDYYGSFKLVE